MQIILNEKEFQGLTKRTQDELLKLLADPTANGHQTNDNLVELPFMLFKKFMENVSKKTALCIKEFGETGRVRWSRLQTLAGGDDTGVRSGIHRRIRKMLDAPEAILLEWDYTKEEFDTNDELSDGEYYVSETTYQSIRRYYEM